MIPRFRVWEIAGKRMVIVVSIDFRNKFIEYTYSPYNDYNRVVSEFLDFCDVVIMQFTGLFDKNGKEIFEGDIVVNQYGDVGYIAYLQQEAGFVVVLKKSDYRLGHRNTGESYEVATNHEIIGNIFENSELLERVVQ